MNERRSERMGVFNDRERFGGTIRFRSVHGLNIPIDPIDSLRFP